MYGAYGDEDDGHLEDGKRATGSSACSETGSTLIAILSGVEGDTLEALLIGVGWLLPLLIVGYILWLLTRLTQTVERIEYRLTQLVEGERSRSRSE